MAVVRWKFEDLATGETYTVPINPKSATGPSYEKNFLYQPTAAADGSVLVFEGRDKPQKIDFEGTILVQAHLEALIAWWKHRNQLQLTDEFGREYIIVFESFVPSRKRSIHYPWKTEYKASVLLLRPV